MLFIKKKRIIATILMISLIISSSIFSASAADITESENNNNYTTADITYDDYNNYGTISSVSDVDWWKINFTQSGTANFWLGTVASCDFKLELYDGLTLAPLASSDVGTTGVYEYIKARVVVGKPYYVKISSKSGYSSTNYLFRIKRYALSSANVFTVDDAGERRATATNVLPALTNMGYTPNDYYNANGRAIYNALPNADVVLTHSHADPGIINAHSYTYLYASTPASSPAGSLEGSISDFAYGALSNTKLVVFCGCYTSETSTEGFGNLLTAARDKQAFVAMAWPDENLTSRATQWLTYFFEYLSYGFNVQGAVNSTNLWFADLYQESESLLKVEIVGNPSALVLGIAD